MPIQNMAWHWGWADNNASTSLAVNFSAQQAVVLCSLSQADGEGLIAGGIRQLRTTSGTTNFGISGGSFWLPPQAFDQHMTGVTGELDVGGDQQGTMTVMVWLWS
jgi:hypothetical protein